MQSFVSQTFLSFAQPLLAQDAADLEFLRGAMGMAVTAWNAVAFEQVLGDATQLKDIETQLETDPTLPMVQYLIKRKREMFADHEFAISEWDIVIGEDKTMKLKIEGRDLRSKSEGK